LNKSTDKLRMN